MLRAWYLHYTFQSHWIWGFVFHFGWALVYSHGLKPISGWCLLRSFHLPGNQFVFLRGFSRMQTGEQAGRDSWRFALKAHFWSKLKHKCRCVLTVLLGEVLIYVVPCFWPVTVLVTILFGNNETWSFVLFSLGKKADSFLWELSKIQNREGTSRSESLAQYLAITSVYHYIIYLYDSFCFILLYIT